MSQPSTEEEEWEQPRCFHCESYCQWEERPKVAPVSTMFGDLKLCKLFNLVGTACNSAGEYADCPMAHLCDVFTPGGNPCGMMHTRSFHVQEGLPVMQWMYKPIALPPQMVEKVKATPKPPVFVWKSVWGFEHWEDVFGACVKESRDENCEQLICTFCKKKVGNPKTAKDVQEFACFNHIHCMARNENKSGHMVHPPLSFMNRLDKEWKGPKGKKEEPGEERCSWHDYTLNDDDDVEKASSSTKRRRNAGW
jgi:hypothetical protein